MSLRARIVVAAAVAVAVAVAAASVAVYMATRAELRGQIDRALEGRSDDVVVRTRIAPRPGERRTEQPLVVPLAVPAAGEERDFAVTAAPVPFGGAPGFVQIVRQDGTVEAPQEFPRLPVTARTTRVARGTEEPFLEDATVDGTRVRVYTSRLSPGDGEPVAVQVARPLDEVNAALRRLRWILGTITLGGIGGAALLGLVVARSSLAPVRRLTSTAEHVAATRDLTRRIELAGGDELARLARAFNAMLAELESAVLSQRQLVADASHELRTPLTSLRTNLEVLARDRAMPAGEREALLTDLTTQLEELSTLVADLVELARDGESHRAADPEPVRLDLLVAEAVESARAHARGRVTFTTDLAAATVRLAAPRVRRAVANLLDNALKWSPDGAMIDVVVRGAEVVVRDRGPGIDAGDLPHVFDRFYRAPGARGRPGSGLGLAIVRQVAELHGGWVRAERAEGGGTRMRLHLAPPARRSGTS